MPNIIPEGATIRWDGDDWVVDKTTWGDLGAAPSLTSIGDTGYLKCEKVSGGYNYSWVPIGNVDINKLSSVGDVKSYNPNSDGILYYVNNASSSEKWQYRKFAINSNDTTTNGYDLTSIILNDTKYTIPTYSLPLAAYGTRGGIQIGFSESNSGSDSNRNYAVKLSSEKAYVNVPWTDEKAKQTYTSGSDSNSYDLLFAYTPYTNYTLDGNAGTVTEGVRRSFNIRYTPSTETLTVSNINGKVTQIATALKNDGWLQIIGVVNAEGSGRTELKYTNLNMKNKDILFPDGGNILYGTTSSNVSVFRYYNSGTNDNHLQIGQGASNFVTEIYGSKGVYLPNANQASSGLRIGDAVLYWDDTNQALALTKVSTTEHPGTVGNFYATGGVSALGMSNGTSSIDAMTFGSLTVNNDIAVGGSISFGTATIYEDTDAIQIEDTSVNISGYLKVLTGEDNTTGGIWFGNYHLWVNAQGKLVFEGTVLN